MNKLVSIIIPIYNSEKYLNRCIDSLLSQTYKNIEIVLVNDGSTDRSYNICTKYLKEDRRIKLYTQKKMGVSAARNKGIDISKGDYITFVDSDDYIEQNMIESLVNLMTDEISMSICRLNIVSYENTLNKTSQKSHIWLLESRKNYICELDKFKLWGSVCKMIKRELLQNVRFDEQIAIAEDLLFNVMIIYNNDNFKIVATDACLYNYYSHSESAMHQTYNSNIFHGFFAEQKSYEILCELGLQNKVYNVLYNGFKNFYGQYARLNKEDKKYYQKDLYESNKIVKRYKKYLLKMNGKKPLEYLATILTIMCPKLFFIFVRLYKK